MTEQTRRLAEWVLVLGVAILPGIFSSIYTFLTGRPLYNPEAFATLSVWGIFSELTALALLLYVLSRQGRTFTDLGVSFRWRDLFSAAILVACGYIGYLAVYYAAYYAYHLVTGRVFSGSVGYVEHLRVKLTWWYGCYLALNPCFEELIVRAYTISEVQALTQSTAVAVMASVALQSAYHLHYGWFGVVSLMPQFVIYSWYYARSGRIVPVIIAHLVFDVLGAVVYALP